jgi:hypothetical protein
MPDFLYLLPIWVACFRFVPLGTDIDLLCFPFKYKFWMVRNDKLTL